MSMSFDQPRMHWLIGQERWPIQAFDAREGLNQPMTARIELSARLGREPTELLGQPSRLEILGTDGNRRHFDGVISAAEWHDTPGRDRLWTITLASKLLTGRRQERSRLMMTASRQDAVTTLLQEMGYRRDEVHWQLSSGAQHLSLPRLQARENNYDCFARLLSEAGWNYWFETRPNSAYGSSGRDAGNDFSERLVICEQQRFPELDLPPLYAASRYNQSEPGHINRLSDLDYDARLGMAPSLRLRIRSGDAFAPVGLQRPAPLARYQTGHWESFAAPQDQVASDRQIQQDAARQAPSETRVHLVSHQPMLRAGHRLSIDCYRGAHPELSGDYLLLSVEHHGEQPHQADENGARNGLVQYRNRAQLLSIRERRILPAIIEPPEDLPLLFPARIESRSPLYADLDQDGRYYLRTRFDATRPDDDTPHSQASPAIEVRVPYASPLGERHKPVGWHFPLLDQSTVLVSCLNGDPNRPLIMGFSPNRQVLNPVTRNNATQYRLISPAQNELSFDDAPANPCILLQTFDGDVRLALNSQESEPFIELATRYGALTIGVAKDLIQKAIDGSLNERIAQHRRLQVQQNSHTKVDGKVHYQSGQHQNLRAQKNLRQSAGGDLSIKVNGEIRTRVDRALTVATQKGWTIQVPAGAVMIRSQGRMLIESQRDILLTARNGQSGILMTPNKVKLFGQQITLKAQKGVHFNGDVHYDTGAGLEPVTVAHTAIDPIDPVEPLEAITPVEPPERPERPPEQTNTRVHLTTRQRAPVPGVPAVFETYDGNQYQAVSDADGCLLFEGCEPNEQGQVHYDEALLENASYAADVHQAISRGDFLTFSRFVHHDADHKAVVTHYEQYYEPFEAAVIMAFGEAHDQEALLYLLSKVGIKDEPIEEQA